MKIIPTNRNVNSRARMKGSYSFDLFVKVKQNLMTKEDYNW